MRKQQFSIKFALGQMTTVDWGFAFDCHYYLIKKIVSVERLSLCKIICLYLCCSFCYIVFNNLAGISFLMMTISETNKFLFKKNYFMEHCHFLNVQHKK